MRNPNLASFNRPAIVRSTLTRPANTTQYAPGDVIASSASAPIAQKLLNVASIDGGYGRIESAMLIDSANQATKLQADVFLFSSAISLDNDNAAFSPSDADMSTCVAIIPFYRQAPVLNAADVPTNAIIDSAIVGNATSGSGGNCIFVHNDLEKMFKCADNCRDLWWVLVDRNAYTPVASETFTLQLDIMKDR